VSLEAPCAEAVAFDTICDEHESAQVDHLEEAECAVLDDKDVRSIEIPCQIKNWFGPLAQCLNLQDLRLPGTLRSTCHMKPASSQCVWSTKLQSSNKFHGDNLWIEKS
jgi:hypothetical protein